MQVYRLKPKADKLSPPWTGFSKVAEASLNAIWVSHRPSRKVSGPLHEETNYGATENPGILVRRKKLSDLKDTELKKIRDPEVRKTVLDYKAREKRLFRVDLGGKAFKEEIDQIFSETESIAQKEIDQVEDKKLRGILSAKLKKKNPLQDAQYGKITLPSGIPIKKARLLIANRAAVVLREREPKELLIPGNTHHLAIFSIGAGKYHFEPVTLLEATRRKKAKLPVINRTPPAEHPEAEFVMSLCSGDTILTTSDGVERLYRFSNVRATDCQVRFLAHNDARDSKTRKLYTASPGSFSKNFPSARKVEILPNGDTRRS